MKKLHVTIKLEMSVPDDWELVETSEGTPVLKLPTGQFLDLAIEPRTRSCLVGRNGAGKSTLMKVVMGLIEPDSGTRSIQGSVKFAYVPQEPLIAGDTLLDYAISNDAEHWTAEAWLETFGMDPHKSTKGLSGGEIRRAALAKAFAEEPDLLHERTAL